MEKALKFRKNVEGIATLEFDLPGEKINKLSRPVMEELSSLLDELSQDESIRALLISSAKPNIFIAGADISEIEKVHNEAEAIKVVTEGHAIFNKLEALPFPTIAIIDGVCLGGGLELALACKYRIATDSSHTSLGLPEVSLGVIPGWGGTQRLPKLIGIQESLKIILTGKPIPARKAIKNHLIDALYPQEFLQEELKKFISRCLDPQGQESILKKRATRNLITTLLEKNPLGRMLLFSMAKRNLMKKTHGHFPAPLQALDVIKRTCTIPIKKGLQEEAKGFAKVACGKISKNLITLFYISQDLKKNTGSTLAHAPIKEIKNAGILGAGVMGGGIAWLLSYRDIPVRVKDIAWSSITKGFEQADNYYKQLLKIKKLSSDTANLKFHNISGTLAYSGFQNTDIVIEAVVEDMELKKKVFINLESHVSPDTIICSNTSALSITEMASNMRHPERFVGMHFFNPVNRMPLVEIIPGEKTSQETITSVVALAKRLGKTPIVVKDCAGFLVNRILLPYMNESLKMVEEGINFERIDKVLKDFGMPMGPFKLLDEIGIDVAFKVAKNLEEAYGKRFKVPLIAKTLNDEKLLGKKDGKGFYIWSGKKIKRNPEINNILRTPGASNNLIDDKTILDRALLIMLNEASLCIEEGIVEKPEYLDMAMIMGIGFPAFHGGLLRYADDLSISHTYSKLKMLSLEFGKRFIPSKYLQNMKRENKKFYP